MPSVRRLVAAALGALILAGTASAAPPSVTISTSGAGYAKRITVTVSSAPGARPVRKASVRASASMNAPGHFMRVPAAVLAERSPGVYTGTLRFVMLGQWVIRVDVSGASIAPVTRRLTLRL